MFVQNAWLKLSLSPILLINSTNKLLENCDNSNFICKCLNRGGKSKLNLLDHKLLNLKHLNFNKNKKYAQNDPDENLTYRFHPL